MFANREKEFTEKKRTNASLKRKGEPTSSGVVEGRKLNTHTRNHIRTKNFPTSFERILLCGITEKSRPGAEYARCTLRHPRRVHVHVLCACTPHAHLGDDVSPQAEAGKEEGAVGMPARGGNT